MRIEQLELEGFGPFADLQRVDFIELDDAGLFLITGRTGSGKSSILDAICYALYGRAPRYDGGEMRVRSDHVTAETPTRVRLVFRAGDDRWRVTRSPEYERPKLRGGGTTTQKEQALLERWSDGEWQGVAARAVEVGEVLAPVLQLTREQFLQVILLAQGRFQEFLRAKSDERVGLLRALFGTERFSRIERELTERAKALDASVAVATTAMRSDLARLAEVCETESGDDAAWAARAAATTALEAAELEAAEAAAATAFAVADAAAATAVTIADLQRRRRRAVEELAALDAGRAEIDATRRRLDDAVRVLPVLPAIHRTSAARAAVDGARRELDGAVGALGAPEPDPEAAVGALDVALGGLRAPLAEEAQLPRLEREAAEAERARSASAAALARAEAAADTVPVRRAESAARRASAAERAAPLSERTAHAGRARAASAAALQAEVLTAETAEADQALLRAVDAERVAGDRYRSLVTARHAGAAGRLAASLVDGDACPVCGALEHPAPAPTAQAVDDASVDDAQRTLDAAAAARSAASADRAALQVRAAAALAAADGRTAEQAAADLAVAEDAVLAAQRAVGEVAVADRELATIESESTGLAAAVDDARTALAARDEAAVRTRGAVDAATGRVAAARADADSVSALAVRLRERRTALQSVVEATRRLRTAEIELAAAEKGLAGALSEAEVTDAATALACALPPAARAELQRRIDAEAAARAAATSQLADREVAAVTDEPADVARAEAAKTDALAARTEAGRRRVAAALRARQAATLADAIRVADAAVAADRQQLDVLAPLAAVVRGDGANELRMRLESYVLAARLEEIVRAANARLVVMTDGRFSLQHDDSVGYRNVRSGLGLTVFDEYTGRGRPTSSLSGGETFLASLALALGLAEVVSAEAGGVRLDTLFVDEGFGSLDRETLDTAMATLDSLRSGGRVVGLISHVETMQEDIPAGLHVERTAEGTSRIRQRVTV